MELTGELGKESLDTGGFARKCNTSEGIKITYQFNNI
jgi:hypothetical protein